MIDDTIAYPSHYTQPSGATGGDSRSILSIRGQRVMLDADMAALYGASTRVLNQAVKRNRERFPEDFMFRRPQHANRRSGQRSGCAGLRPASPAGAIWQASGTTWGSALPTSSGRSMRLPGRMRTWKRKPGLITPRRERCTRWITSALSGESSPISPPGTMRGYRTGRPTRQGAPLLDT